MSRVPRPKAGPAAQPEKERRGGRLRVAFQGTKIKVIFNGKTYIELDDEHIKGAGAVGVWTKADSVTSFDD
jgi:hypothetical protein